MHYKRGIKLKKVYMIWNIMNWMLELEECFVLTVKKIFLINALMQMEDSVPENTLYLYHLRNWQYDLADIIEFYYAD